MKTVPCYLQLATVAVLLAANFAAAQPPQLAGRGMGNRLGGESPDNPTYLLESESVQKELALSDDQLAQVQKLREAEQKNAGAIFRGVMRMSPNEIQKKLDGRAKAARKKLAKILTPEQMNRLNQINIQVAGVKALDYDDVANELKLTKEQRAEIKDIGNRSRQKAAELYLANSPGPPDAEKMREIKQKQTEISADRNENALAVLTDVQKAAFEKLQGEKFDTSTVKPLSRRFTSRGQIPAPVRQPPVPPGVN